MTSISDSDYQALQGTWQQVSLEDSGVLNPPDAHSAPGAITTITDDHFEVLTVDGERLLAGDSSWTAPPIPKASPGSMPWGVTRASCCRPATAWKETSSYSSRRMKACRDRVYSAPAPGRQCVHSCVDPEPRAHLNLRRDFHKAFTFRSIG